MSDGSFGSITSLKVAVNCENTSRVNCKIRLYRLRSMEHLTY